MAAVWKLCSRESLSKGGAARLIDLRGPEEDLATVEPPASSVTTSSGRIRKVSLKVIRVHYVLFLVQCTLHTADEWAQLIFYPIVLSPQSMKRMHHRQTELLNLKH